MSDDENKKSENQIPTVPPPPGGAASDDAFDAATRIGPVPEEIRLLIEEKLAAKGPAPSPRLTPPSGVPRPASVPRTSIRPSLKPLTELKKEPRIDDESTMMVGNVADLMDASLARPTPPPRAQDDDEEEEDSTRMLEPDWQKGVAPAEGDDSTRMLPPEATKSVLGNESAKTPAPSSARNPVPTLGSIKKSGAINVPTPPVGQPISPDVMLAEAQKGMSSTKLFLVVVAFFIGLAAVLVAAVKYLVR